MAGLTFLQSPVLTKFILPFLLIFFIVFAVLEKTKIFANKQLNALIAFVTGFIFVGAVFPKEMVGNLILFLAIALVVIFVVLLLWGFVAGEEGLKFSDAPKGLKWVIGVVIIIAVVFAVFWAAGLDTIGFLDRLFHSSWSDSFWTNVFFIVMVAAALAVVISGGKPKAS
jgi:hypothetical protein